MGDLLDILAAMDGPCPVHALIPTMALACGVDMLSLPRTSGRRWTTRYRSAEVTCPACVAALSGAVAA